MRYLQNGEYLNFPACGVCRRVFELRQTTMIDNTISFFFVRRCSCLDIGQGQGGYRHHVQVNQYLTEPDEPISFVPQR